MKTTKIYTGLIAVLLSLLSFANLKAADFTVEQWRVLEISLTSSLSYTDPFNDVEVTATFTGPDGSTIVRPAFWDGGTSWKIRFAPTLTGNWTMTTTCTNPSNTGLHNVSKTIECNAYTGTFDIYKHGFLKTDTSGRYFVYNDGTPFFYLGDTHWLFTHERFNTSNVAGVASQFKYTLDKRVAQGFTVYQTEAIQQPHTTPATSTHSGLDEEPFCNFRDGFTAADLPGLLNMDNKFKYIADNGLVHANSEVCWTNDPKDYPIYTDAYMYKLGKYWVARYGAYPVLWTISQEIDKNVYGYYNSTTISKWYSVGQAIADNDAYKQPLSAHMENSGSTIASTSWWGKKTYHTWWAVQVQDNLTNITNVAKDFWNSRPSKPSILYESPYDGFWTDTKGARGAGYKAFQSGMYGYGYGANGTWNDLYAVGDYGTDYEMPGRYLSWYDGANLPAAGQLIHLRNFYSSHQWWKLIPRFNDHNWASFTDVSNTLLSTDGQKVFVTYFYGAGKATGTLKNIVNGITYTAKWFDPLTGIYTNIADFTTSNGQWIIPPRPTVEDWVLLVQTDEATPETPVPVLGDNLGLNKTYSSSSNYTATQVASKAFDSDYNTNWQSVNGTFANQWLNVNFGAATTFNTVILSEWGDRTKGFRIEYSTNGTVWSTAYTGTTIGSSSFVSFPVVTGNYARIYFLSGTDNQPIIYEFEIYNSNVTSISTVQAIPESKQGICNLYPNPAKNEVRFVYNTDKDDELTISVMNNAGQVMQVKKESVVIGQNPQMIDISKLSDGLYFVKTKDEKVSVKTFIVRN